MITRTLLLKAFAINYLVVAGLTVALVAFPSLLFPIFVVTGPVALPLLFVPTVAVYLTVLWPAVLVWSMGLRVTAAGLAVVTLAIAAVGPGLLARRLAERDAKLVLATDINGRLSSPPRAIEFEVPPTPFADRFKPLRNAPCDEACQILLLGREVDAVRVRGVWPKTRHSLSPVVYTYQERPSCPKAFDEGKTALPVTQIAASQGRCIVPIVDGEWAPGIKFIVSKESEGWTSSEPLLHTAGDLTRYELWTAEGQDWRIVSRTTELRTKVLSIPLLFSYWQNLQLGGERRKLVFGATNAAEVLRAAAGYRLTMPDPGPAEPIQQTIDRILSSGGDEPLGPELMAVIDQHLDTLRSKRELPPDDIALLHRLLSNKRVVELFHYYQVIQRRPGLAAPLIGEMLNRLEKPDDGKGFNHSFLTWMVVRAPIESVKPHGARVVRIAEKSDRWEFAPLLRVVGRLDVDGSDLLARRLKAPSHEVREAAAVGVCAADQPWAVDLLPAVEGILEYYRQKRSGGNGDLIVALKIMKRRGRDAEVDNFLRTLPDTDARLIRASLTRAPRQDIADDCAP